MVGSWSRFGVSVGPEGMSAAFSGGGRVYSPTEFSFALSRFVNFVQDWGPAWDNIVESFRRAMTEQFDSEGKRLTGGWAPLTPLYGAWKAEAYPGQPILSLTGALRSAATNPQVRKAPKQLNISIDDPKYYWHQIGTARMVARPILGFPLDLQVEWGKIFQAFALQCARRAL